MYLFLYCALCFSCNCVYCDVRGTCTMLGVGILHYQQVLCYECFDVSELTTRKGNGSIVQKENCFAEEINGSTDMKP